MSLVLVAVGSVFFLILIRLETLAEVDDEDEDDEDEEEPDEPDPASIASALRGFEAELDFLFSLTAIWLAL
jgi:hypothetical protein